MRSLSEIVSPAPSRNKPRRQGPSKIVLAVLGVIILAIIGYGLSLAVLAVNGIPGLGYYDVNANFKNADNLVKHDKVRINGVFVGQVLGTRIQQGHAVVKLQLKKSLKPLKSDTTVRIRPQSAVGTRFLELYPGQHGTPLKSGGTIPESQTKTEVPLDTVLNTLDTRRRSSLQTLLQQLGVGVAGRGDDANKALQDVPPALNDFEAVAHAINEDGGFGPFVAKAQGAANAADPVRFDIANGFGNGQRALEPFVSQAAELKAALDAAPPALQAARAGLQRSQPFIAELDRFARAARPALSAARTAFPQTERLLVEARPGLRATPATLTELRPATPAVLGVLDTLRPKLPTIDDALTSSLPPLDELGPRGCDVQSWTHNWASATSYGDATSNFLRYDLVTPDETSVAGNGGNMPGVFRDPYPTPCKASLETASGTGK